MIQALQRSAFLVRTGTKTVAKYPADPTECPLDVIQKHITLQACILRPLHKWLPSSTQSESVPRNRRTCQDPLNLDLRMLMQFPEPAFA